MTAQAVSAASFRTHLVARLTVAGVAVAAVAGGIADVEAGQASGFVLEERRVCSPVDLEIAGRHGVFRVVEVPDALPNLIGQIPLEELDLVVDLRKRRVVPTNVPLVPNPATKCVNRPSVCARISTPVPS